MQHFLWVPFYNHIVTLHYKENIFQYTALRKFVILPFVTR